MAKFTYLGTGLTNHNCIHDKIKVKLNSGNAWYHLVQNLLSCLLYKNIKIEIQGTLMWHSFYQTNITWNIINTHSYFACCIWGKVLYLLHWGKNTGWGCVQIGCCGRYLDVRGRKCKESGENCIVNSFMTCTSCQMLLWHSCHGSLDG